MKQQIVFGTIIIDKLHQFFGKNDPSACVVVTVWGNEENDGQEAEVWLEHFRGHIKKTYADLRDSSKWEILDRRVDTKEKVLEQLKQAENDYVAHKLDLEGRNI